MILRLQLSRMRSVSSFRACSELQFIKEAEEIPIMQGEHSYESYLNLAVLSEREP